MISPAPQDLAPLFEREVGRDQGTAPLTRLDDDRRGAETGDDSIPCGKALWRGLDARRVLRDDES